jgi:peptidyl-prolyl cis-trans isomerase B (cyclophilin B)
MRIMTRSGRLAALVGAIAVAAVVSACGSQSDSGSSTDSGSSAEASPSEASPAATPPGACAYVATPDRPPARPVSVPSNANPPTTGTVAVTLATNQGAIPIVLDRTKAPCTVASFLNLTNAGFYNGTPCHRLVTVDSLKVLQCGDPSGSGTGGPGYTIPDEPPTGLADAGGGASVYPRGTLAMAKTSAPNSGGSQFFLVFGNSQLPPNYTIFGTVAAPGLGVLDKVAAGGGDDSNSTGDGGPKIPVTITSAKAD